MYWGCRYWSDVCYIWKWNVNELDGVWSMLGELIRLREYFCECDSWKTSISLIDLISSHIHFCGLEVSFGCNTDGWLQPFLSIDLLAPFLLELIQIIECGIYSGFDCAQRREHNSHHFASYSTSEICAWEVTILGGSCVLLVSDMRYAIDRHCSYRSYTEPHSHPIDGILPFLRKLDTCLLSITAVGETG